MLLRIQFQSSQSNQTVRYVYKPNQLQKEFMCVCSSAILNWKLKGWILTSLRIMINTIQLLQRAKREVGMKAWYFSSTG